MQHPPLRPYQIEGVEKLIDLVRWNGRNAAILADDPGLGKTAQVAEYINRTKPHNVLIVCPASLRLNWKAELDRWLEKDSLPDFEAVIRSYDEIAGGAEPEDGPRDLLVFDEAHYLKNPDAKRTKTGLALKAATRLFLTGTPVVNRPMDLYPILQSVGAKMDRVTYGKRYCNGHLSRIQYRPPKYAWDFSGASNQEELAGILRKHLMVRRTKGEVLKDLPPKIRQIIELDIPDGESPSLKDAVSRMFDGMASAAENISELKSIAFTELSRARLDIARNKLPYVLRFIHEILEEEDKVVVFAYHREILAAIEKEFHARQYSLSCRAVSVCGGMTDKQKDEAVRDFQTSPFCRVFAGQITAAGTGLTLTAAKTVVFAELDWVPGNIIQAEDRCHRLGQTGPVRVFHLAAKDSVDARMIRAVVEKQNNIERIMQ